ncbi:MAG TPA: excinuclease ABC subunit UvrC, partial [Methylomirabilota bacterium]|nr:excinuclease ABC subunit UvrC [Methylomirabilota bacterium]
EALRFEQAAITRDKLRAVERTMEQQKMAAFSRAEHDVIGMAREEDEACVQVMQVRNGKLIGREHFIVEGARDVPDAEVLGSFLQQYYASTDALPRAILSPVLPHEADDLAAYLADRRGVRVTISVPERGEKRRLLALATQNAVEALARERAEWMADSTRRDEALGELAGALGLPKLPERIECYDMSNIQGTSAVGSMVVFVDGRPEPKEYRRFRIRSGDTPDDFRMMAEVLRRRFSRVAKLRSETGALTLDAVGADEVPEEVGERGRDAGWAVPDLVIVDGGKGQLSAAVGALDALQITDVPLVGLAKRFEELYLPGRAAPVVLPRRSQALYLVQRIRDEAHRFAITYHRDVRGKRALRSELDDIAGIGPGRKKALLKRFGSVRRIREASVEEVAATPGISRDLAERLKGHLAREGMLA